MDDEERLEAEEAAAERQAKLKQFDWSFAQGEQVVYGLALGEEDAWLALPRSVVEEMADTRRAVRACQDVGRGATDAPGATPRRDGRGDDGER